MPVNKKAISIIIISIISIEVYSNSLFNSFVYDDPFQILNNKWITSFKYLPQIFTSDVWGFAGNGGSNYYRPLMHVIYMLTYNLFGLKPIGFHLVSVLLHTIVCIFVFLVGVKLFKKDYVSQDTPFFLFPPFIAAVIFAVHPIHTETVAWAAGVPDLSCSLFFLASFYFFIRGRESNQTVPILVSAFFFFLAMLCKEPGLTLPAVLIAYDLSGTQSGNNIKTYFKRYTPYLIAAGVYLLMRFNALKGFVPAEKHSGAGQFINIFPLFGKYIERLLFPVNLSICYGFKPIGSMLEPRIIFSFFLAVFFVFIIFYSFKKNRKAFFAFTLLLVPLLPAFYVTAIGQSGVFAERYLYLPSMGFVFLLSSGIHYGLKEKRRTSAVFFLLMVILFSYGTIKRNEVWRGNYTLWTDTVKKAPDEALPHYNLGNVFVSDNKMEEAQKEYETAIRLDPSNADAHNNLGILYVRKGLLDKAIENFKVAVSLQPGKQNYMNDLAQATEEKLSSLSKGAEHNQPLIFDKDQFISQDRKKNSSGSLYPSARR